MIEFTRILVEGFCSIGNTLDLQLNTKGITVIRGVNGNGKSTIFSAIVWVLYGKNIKGKPEVNTWKKFQPKGYSGTKVEIFFKTGDNRIHRIIRCLKYTKEVEGSKGGNRLIYQIDGDTISERGKRGIQEIINDNIGMSYDLFLNSILFGQGLKRLIQESGTNQREIFEEVFELGYLTKAKKIAQDRYQKALSEYQQAANQVNNAETTIKTLENSQEVVQEKQLKFKEDKAQAINKLKQQLRTFKEQKEEAEAELERFNLGAIEKKLARVQEKLQKEKEQLKAAKQATGIPLEELIDKIINLLEKGKIDSSLNELLTLKKAFTTVSSCQDNIYELQDKLSTLTQKKASASEVKSKINRLEQRVSDYKHLIKDKKAETPDFQAIIDSNQEKIEGLQDKLKTLTVTRDTFKESRDLYQWAYTDPLGNMGIKSYLFESCLHQLNDILETYSETLGFSIHFEVDLSSARKDFVTRINLEGQEVEYDELSGGQKQLTHLAMAFSMNSMVAQAQGINIAFLDEVFESLSDDNIEIVIGLIKQVYQDKTLFLITHQESLPIANSRVLKVKRVKGLSEYEV